MTVLRSRVVKSKEPPLSKTKNNNNNSPNSKIIKPRVSSIEPLTPCNTRETHSAHASNSSSAIVMDDGSRSGGGGGSSSSVRRSLRLASKNSEKIVKQIVASGIDEDDSKLCDGGVELEDAVVEDSVEVSKEGELGFQVESGVEGDEMVESGIEGLNKGKRKLGLGFEFESDGIVDDVGCLRLRSGKKVVVRGGVRGTRGGDDGGGMEIGDAEVKVDSGNVEEGQGAEAVNIEGQGRLRREDKGKGKLVDIDMVVEPEVQVSDSDKNKVVSQVAKDSIAKIDAIADRYRTIMAKGNNGSKADVWEELISKCVDSMKSYLNREEKVPLKDIGPSHVAKRRLSSQEKGKGKLADETVVESKGVEIPASDNVAASRTERSNTDTGDMLYPQPPQNDEGEHVTRTRDRFRAQARRSASRFAYFSTTEEEQNHVGGEAEAEMAPREREMNNVEDWPGPFSTAMKIIKERGTNKNFSSGKETPQGTWIPKHDKNHKRFNLHVPLLQDLCMRTLTKNADALTSLDYVPDVLRHKLSHMLCDMRRMNSHFLELLVRGSPTEIRIRDCSWLSEEDFTKIFAEADVNNLAVLQLDQCGRCMPDYILYSTLGRSPNCLPLLSTLSLKGACRLSDIGLSSLLSSAPALRSINLSQCSLLTFGGINNIADSLGSVLRELYLDDCESIDPILMLPALSKLEYLEVLSLAGLHTVCDDFICQLIALRGHKLKELVLADCVDLTDISIKVISKSCTGIWALDLTNLCKLTDCALGYLANGCQLIRSLKLRRNIFSDEAVAAYLETSGGSLEELSLNNISKVGYNTAISLSKCSKNLQNLDLSFCRSMSNEAVGLIADGCLSLKTLKLFGCTQITDVFLDGHSNEQMQVIGRQMTSILGNIKVPELIGPLRYSPL